MKMLKILVKKRVAVVILCAAYMLSMVVAFPVNAAEEFDPVFYANAYPDVVAELGTDPQMLLNHYINYGRNEGRIPYMGAQPGIAVNGISDISIVVQQSVQEISASDYVARTVSLREAVYQSYELTKVAQYATPAIPAGITTFVEEYPYGEAQYSTPSGSWSMYIHGGDLCASRVDFFANSALELASYDNFTRWDIFAGSISDNCEDTLEEFGINLPYVSHKFTQEEIQSMMALLDSPILSQKDYTGSEHIFSDGGRFDAHSQYEIFGYYKGIPIKIYLRDSYVRYAPSYHFLPEIMVASRMTPDGLSAF